MLSRREFVQRVLMGAVAIPFAAELDLERLLWVPKTMVTVPEMPCFDLNTLFEQVARERTVALDVAFRQLMFKGQPIVFDEFIPRTVELRLERARMQCFGDQGGHYGGPYPGPTYEGRRIERPRRQSIGGKEGR